MMLVGFKLGKCQEKECNKDASVQIRGINYCYEHGKLHISEAVEDGLKEAEAKYE